MDIPDDLHTTVASPTTTAVAPQEGATVQQARTRTRTRQAPKAKPEPKPEPIKKPWEKWAAEKRTPEVDRRRAPPFNRWAAGKYVTEAEFDAGVHAAANCLIR